MAMMLSLLGLHSLRSMLGCSEANFHPGSCYTRMQPSPRSVLALSVQMTEPPEQARDVSCQPLRMWQGTRDTLNVTA